MVNEADIEELEKMALADTDSDAYFDRLGNAFSEFIENYNSRLVFEKDNARVKPLDRYKLGGSSQRNTLFLLARSGAQSMVGSCRQRKLRQRQYDKAGGLSRGAGACEEISAGGQPQAGFRRAY